MSLGLLKLNKSTLNTRAKWKVNFLYIKETESYKILYIKWSSYMSKIC